MKKKRHPKRGREKEENSKGEREVKRDKEKKRTEK